MLKIDRDAIQPHEFFVTERAGYEHTIIHQTEDPLLQRQIKAIVAQINTEDVVRAALHLDQSKKQQTAGTQFLLAISNEQPDTKIQSLGSYSLTWEQQGEQYFLFLKSV